MDYISIESSGDYPGHVYIDLGTSSWLHGIAFWLSGEGVIRHSSGIYMGVKVDTKDCVRFIKGSPPDNHVGITGATKIIGGTIAAERTVGDWRYLAIRSDHDHSIDIAIISKYGDGTFVLQIRPEGIYRYGYVSKLLGLPVDSNGRLQINRKIR